MRGIGLSFHQSSGKPSLKRSNLHQGVLVGISRASLKTNTPGIPLQVNQNDTTVKLLKIFQEAWGAKVKALRSSSM